MSRTLYPGQGHAVTVQVDFGFGSGPLTDSPTWVDSTDYVREFDTFRGKTGELDDVQPGSCRLVLSSPNREFDPTNGPAYVTFPGTAGSYWSVPDVAAFSGATSLDVRVAVQLPDWTPAAQAVIAGQGVAGSSLCWQLIVTTAGFLSFQVSDTGTGSSGIASTSRVAAVDGQLVCVRGVWESSGGVASLAVKRTTEVRARADCESDDGWVTLNAGTGLMSGSSLFNSSAVVAVGAQSDGSSPVASGGRVLFMTVAATGAAALVLDPVSAGAVPTSPPTSWVSELGGTWSRTGTASVVLSGAYWRRLVPGVPVRIRATYNSITYDVWRGYVLRWPVEYRAMGQDTVVEVEAVDLLAWLDELPLPDSPYGIELEIENVADLAAAGGGIGNYWPLHEPFPLQEFGEVYGGSGGSYGYLGTVSAGGPSQPAGGTASRLFGEPGVSMSRAVQIAPAPLPDGAFLSYSPTLAFWVHQESQVPFQVITQFGLAWVNNPSGVSYVQYQGGGATVINPVPTGSHFCACYSLGGAQVFTILDGADWPGVLLEDALSDFSTYPTLWVNGSGATISDVTLGKFSAALYDGYRSGIDGRTGDKTGERIEWLLDAGGIPAARRVITTDASTFLGPAKGGGSLLSQVRACNTAEQGRLHVDGQGRITARSRVWRITATAATVSQATFGDTAGEVPYTAITVDAGTRDTIVNTAVIGTTSGATVETRDQDSIDLYGVLPYSASGLPLANAADAANCGAWIIADRSHPRTRVRNLAVSPLGNATTVYPQTLGRELGDRVTVNRRPINPQTKAVVGATISEQVTVEGVQHRVTPSEWVTVFHTAPAARTAAQGGYFTADDAVLSVVDSGVVAAY